MADTDPDTPDLDAMEERLEQLDEGIEDARRQAEEHGTLEDSTPEPTYRDPDPEHEGDEPHPSDSA